LQKPLTPITTEGTVGVGKEQVTADLQGGVYKVPGREMSLSVKVKNNTSEPLRLGEYTAAGLRFLNPDVFTTKPEFPDYLLADRGLSTDATALRSRRARRRRIQVKIQDAAGISSVCPTWPTTPTAKSAACSSSSRRAAVASRLKSADRSFRSSSPATCPEIDF